MMSELKTCSKCGQSKPLESFPKEPRRRCGPSNPCKACKLIQMNAWRNRNRERVNAMARVRNKTEPYLANTRERVRKWKRNHPEAWNAQNARYRARSKGRSA